MNVGLQTRHQGRIGFAGTHYSPDKPNGTRTDEHVDHDLLDKLGKGLHSEDGHSLKLTSGGVGATFSLHSPETGRMELEVRGKQITPTLNEPTLTFHKRNIAGQFDSVEIRPGNSSEEVWGKAKGLIRKLGEYSSALSKNAKSHCNILCQHIRP